MLKPGDVEIARFAGATEEKRRPMVVLSNEQFHQQRPDVMLGVLTSNILIATASTDYVLQDWQDAGLRVPTACRTYIGMKLLTEVHRIGRLSDRDWRAVRQRLQLAMD